MGYDCEAYVIAGIPLTEQEFYKLAQKRYPGLSKRELNENAEFCGKVDRMPTKEAPGLSLMYGNTYIFRRNDERAAFKSYYLIAACLGSIEIRRERSADLKLDEISDYDKQEFLHCCNHLGLSKTMERYGIWLISAESY